jgi:hypothetical protein
MVLGWLLFPASTFHFLLLAFDSLSLFIAIICILPLVLLGFCFSFLCLTFQFCFHFSLLALHGFYFSFLPLISHFCLSFLAFDSFVNLNCL